MTMLSEDLQTDLRLFETGWDADVQCQASETNHVHLKVTCSGSATHRLRCLCGGKGAYPVCANVTASVKDPTEPAICRLHRSPLHVQISEL